MTFQCEADYLSSLSSSALAVEFEWVVILAPKVSICSLLNKWYLRRIRIIYKGHTWAVHRNFMLMWKAAFINRKYMRGSLHPYWACPKIYLSTEVSCKYLVNSRKKSFSIVP